MKNKPNIKYLFEPRSVAIIGASHHKDKIGYKILENIISSGYYLVVGHIQSDGSS